MIKNKDLSSRVYEMSIIFIGCMVLAFFYLVIAQPQMKDDAYMYQGFSEEVVEMGRLNFAKYYGFHGQALFTAPFYWISGRHDAILWVTGLFAFLCVPAAYKVGKVYGSSLSSGTMAMLAVLAMPLLYVTALRGFVESIQLFWMLLFVYFLKTKSRLAYLAFAIIIVIKPWGLALFPAVLYLTYALYYKPGNIAQAVKGFLLTAASGLLLFIHALLTYYQTGYYANAWSAGATPETSLALTNLFGNWERYIATFFAGQDAGGISWLAPVSTGILAVYLIEQGYQDLKKKNYTMIFLMGSVGLNLLMVGLCPWFFHKYFLSSYVVMICIFVLVCKQYPPLRFLFFLGSYPVFVHSYQVKYLAPLVSAERYFSFTGLEWIWIVINLVALLEYLFFEKAQSLQRTSCA